MKVLSSLMGENKIIESQDGSHTIASSKFGVTYHSIYGAIHESITVFLSAGLQYHILNGKNEIAVFEMGLGTGLNALLTLIEANNTKVSVRYSAVEKYPISVEEARQLNYLKQLGASSYDEMFTLIHSDKITNYIELTPHFTFNKIIADLTYLEIHEKFDLIYYDAFAPSAQEELWTESMMKKMYSMLNRGGILVTYCAKGSFKRALKASGFEVEVIPGPPGKREMTRAHKVK